MKGISLPGKPVDQNIPIYYMVLKNQNITAKKKEGVSWWVWNTRRLEGALNVPGPTDSICVVADDSNPKSHQATGKDL